MKKCCIVWLLLLLVGCSEASTIASPEIDFDFEEEAVIVVPQTKIVQLLSEESYLAFTIYTTYEQAAYLRRNAPYITLSIEDVMLRNVTTTLGERKEIGDSIFYEVGLVVTEKSIVLADAPEEIHALSLYIADTEIFTKNISAVMLKKLDGPVKQELVIDLKQVTEDGLVYNVKNNTENAIFVEQVYIEGAEAGGIVLLNSFPKSVEPGVQYDDIYEELAVNDLRGLIMVFAQTATGGKQVVDLYNGPSNKEYYFQQLADMGY